jgi:parvulin-like peptidyl-prolyl isomerase
LESEAKKQKNSRVAVISILALLLISSGAAAFFYKGSKPTGFTCNPKKDIAQVNNSCITRVEFESAFKRQELVFLSDKQQMDQEGIKQTVIEELVKQRLVNLFAEQNGISITQEIIDERYSKAVASVGTEEQYLEKIKTLQGIDKARVKQIIEEDILKEEVEKKLNMPIKIWLEEQKKQAVIKTF